MIVYYVLTLLIGVLLGGVMVFALNQESCSGYLRVDKSDPDGPYLFLELREPVKKVEKKEYVLLRVKCENFIPQQ